jgi:hypothetical protein
MLCRGEATERCLHVSEATRELRPSSKAAALQYGLRMRSPFRFFALVFVLAS